MPAQQLGIPLHLLQHWPFNKRSGVRRLPAQQLGILLYHPFFKLHTALLLQSLYSAVPTTSNSTQLYRPITPSSLQAQLMLLLQSLFFNGVPIFKFDPALLPLSLYRAVPIDTTASTLLYSTQLYPSYHQYTTFTTPSLQRAL